MPKIFTSKTQKIGKIGENLTCKFLVKRGFSIKERNYNQKWGEIDIIATKDSKLYFIEVKSVLRNNLNKVSREMLDNYYKPEDNMHPWKMKRMAKTIQVYMMSNKISEETNWQVDLIIAFIDLKNKKVKFKTLENIIL
jgi:putative endonuclease